VRSLRNVISKFNYYSGSPYLHNVWDQGKDVRVSLRFVLGIDRSTGLYPINDPLGGHLLLSSLRLTSRYAFAAYGLREKRDTLADEEMEEESKEQGYYDEGKEKTSDPFAIEDTSKPSKRTRNLRKRAKQRRGEGD